jgi:hypothetical protein
LETTIFGNLIHRGIGIRLSAKCPVVRMAVGGVFQNGI